MNAQPKFSVIVPVYNSAAFLNEALDSVLGQQYENMEVVCVDDGSADGSPEILRQYAVRDSRIKVYSNMKNLGIGENRNRALKLAAGEWLLFMDCDDWYEPGLLTHLADIISRNPDINIVEFRFNLSTGTGHKTPAGYLDRGTAGIRNVADEDILLATALWNKCFRAEFVRRHGLKMLPLSGGGEEIPFHICAFLLNQCFYYSDFIGYNWRINPDSFSRNSVTRQKQYDNFFIGIDLLGKEIKRLGLSAVCDCRFLAVKILGWSIGADIDNPAYKLFYCRVRNLFRAYALQRKDFRSDKDFRCYRRVCRQPFWYHYWRRKIRRLMH